MTDDSSLRRAWKMAVEEARENPMIVGWDFGYDPNAVIVRQAIALYFPDETVVRVGDPWGSCGRQPSKGDPEITQITVSQDLQGSSAGVVMERWRVFVGETVVLEGPLVALESVEYALGPSADASRGEDQGAEEPRYKGGSAV